MYQWNILIYVGKSIEIITKNVGKSGKNEGMQGLQCQGEIIMLDLFVQIGPLP